MRQNLRELKLISSTSDVLEIKYEDLVKFELSPAGNIGRTFSAVSDIQNGHLILGSATIGTTEPQIHNAFLLYNTYDYEFVYYKGVKYLIVTKRK